VRIVAISDTHMQHEGIDVPDGDVLIHAGDFCGRGTLADVEKFNEFMERQPHRHKIAIAGNHDFCFEQTPDLAREQLTACHYLQDEALELDGFRFYGSPWQPEFMDWAFNLPRGGELRAKWELIPVATDVLITHTPPAGIGDFTLSGEHVGCSDLLDALERIRPALHVFGHIHEGAGVAAADGTTFLNACICDAAYRAVNAPMVHDLKR